MDGKVERIFKTVYLVKSCSRDKKHRVFKRPNGSWACTCEHHKYRRAVCKHMKAAKQFALANNAMFAYKGYRELGYKAEMQETLSMSLAHQQKMHELLQPVA